MDREKLALVLSGGGAKGAYEVGVLRALLRLDITPELICGSSIGALNGAIFAEAVEQDRVDEFLDWLTCLWLGEKHLFPFNWRGLWETICLCKMPIRMPSLFSTKRIKTLLSQVIPRTRTTSGYEKIEVAFTGTDLNDAILRVFDRSCAASVLDAVTASLSLPVILSAVKIGSHHFVDGGVAQ